MIPEHPRLRPRETLAEALVPVVLWACLTVVLLRLAVEVVRRLALR